MSEENLEKLASVLENLERMTRLNQALLLLSKIDNKQFIEEESVSINTIIEQIALDFSDYAEHRNIKIELTSKASIAIAMNKDLAVILFTNLIKNAVVHAKENSTINIFIEYQKVTITNEAKHKQLDKNKLFKRFYKVNTHKNSTGLGLPITKAIADKYDFELSYTYLNKHIFSLKFN